MTNQEVEQALKDYALLDQQLAKKLEEKNKLDKQIRYYQTPKKPPVPEKPSKTRLFFEFFGIFVLIAFAFCVILEWKVVEPRGFLLILSAAVPALIVTIFVYKKKNAQACARFVEAGMKYENWKKEKESTLPVLQRKLDTVMREGGELYNRYQNAKLRRILHADYLPYAGTILGYFQHGRVRDLRDAVNLLEQELREHRRDMETEAYRSEMRQQAIAQREAAEEAAAQGRRAANAAEAAAFWSAAAAVSSMSNNQSSDPNDFRVI